MAAVASDQQKADKREGIESRVAFGKVVLVGLNGRLRRHVAVCDWGGSVHLSPVWHSHNGPTDSTCARTSPSAPSSDSPCITEHLPQPCRVSSLAPSPHSASPCCHWVKGGKIHSSPTNGSKWFGLRPAGEVALKLWHITGNRAASALAKASIRNNKQIRVNK